MAFRRKSTYMVRYGVLLLSRRSLRSMSRTEYQREYRAKNRDRINAQRRRNYRKKVEQKRSLSVSNNSKVALKSVMQRPKVVPIVRPVTPNDVMQKGIEVKVVKNEENVTTPKNIGSKNKIIITSVVSIFLALNVFFLTSEQFTMYRSMGYGWFMAILIALLTEAATLLLSGLASWTYSLLWKVLLVIGCSANVAVIGMMLDYSAQHRGIVLAEQSEQVKRIKSEIRKLEILEAPVLARIESLNPTKYKTEIDKLSNNLQAPNGYSHRIGELNRKLESISVNSTSLQVEAMRWQRGVAIAVNLILSGFIGFMWSSNTHKPGAVTRIFRWWKSI